jgi:putative transposase
MPSYKATANRSRFIGHCVGCTSGFPLSFREIEELMLQRGVAVSYETIRR